MDEIRGGLLGGAGVAHSASPFDGLRNLQRRALRRPLEKHMLYEMRNAAETLGLVAAAGRDEKTESNTLRLAWHENNAKGILQLCQSRFHHMRIRKWRREGDSNPRYVI